MLGSAELQNLRGVLADDPLRAVQVLPGVATGDDLRSEFTVRGSDFRHLTFTVDGFATPYLLHTVRGVEDRGPTGSVAMINSDVLDDVTLLNGSYPQRYAGHTGAEVDFRLREGSRERRSFHVAVSGTNASAVAEGPIGRRQRGSWLISARQSYLDLILHRLTYRAVSFGFADAQARLTYDISPRQRIDLTALAGHSRFENDPVEREIDDVHVGLNASVVGVAGWRLTLPRLMLTQRVLAADNHFRNQNSADLELDNGRDRQLAYRADVTASVHRSLELAAGAEVERRDDSRVRRRLAPNRVSLVQLDDYSGDGLLTGGYASARWTPFSRLTIAPGMRADRWSLTGQSTTSPWFQAEWRATGTLKVRAGGGVYQQFPDFDKVLGVSGGVGLRPERARAIRPGRRAAHRPGLPRVDDRLRSRGARHAAAARRRDPRRGEPRRPRIRDHEAREPPRGVCARRGADGAAERHGARRFRVVLVRARAQPLPRHGIGRDLLGDSDQRHTMNAYALYRHSERASFVAKLRIGSNFPIPGYYASRDGPISSPTCGTRRGCRPTAASTCARTATFNWSRRR